MSQGKILIEHIVPGGVRDGDFLHRGTNDGTCSRCRKEIPEEDVPLMLWSKDGNNMLIYCDKCLQPPEVPNA